MKSCASGERQETNNASSRVGTWALLGHACGLDHVTGCHVRKTGTYKFTCGTMPSSNDVAGVDFIY